MSEATGRHEQERERKRSRDRGRGRNNGHGAEAERIRDIPARGWKDVAVRVKQEVAEDRLSLVAAGVAFYGFLALFPALAAIISIWGLFADPATVQQQIAQLSGVLPGSARDLISGAATRIAAGSPTGLGFGVAISLLLTLWSANKGMKGLVEGISIAYDEDPGKRGFFAKNGIALALTLGGIIMAIIAIGLVVGLPIALGFLGLGPTVETLIGLARWPLLALFVIVALAAIYRIAPPRDDAKWRWVSHGAIVATVLWLVASIAFSIYTANFGSFNETYGSVAAVAILLMWFFISAFIVLLGAEINAETEKQTARDTTTGPERPLGKREAVPADTVADRPTMH